MDYEMEKLSANIYIDSLMYEIQRNVENLYQPNKHGMYEEAFSYENEEFSEYVRNHVWSGIKRKFPDFEVRFDKQEQKFIVKW
jgi:hypothetical protein